MKCGRTVHISVVISEEDAADLRALATAWGCTLSTTVWGILADKLWEMRGRRERERWRTSYGVLLEVLYRLRSLRACRVVRAKRRARTRYWRGRQLRERRA